MVSRTPSKPTQAAASKNSPAKASQTLPAKALNFEADAGAGQEGADKDSFAIPFVSILQANSPQVEQKLVKGAESGLFINNITNELQEQIVVIPCAFQRRFLRWAPRKEGGGFRGQYNPVDVELNRVEGLKEVEEDGRTKLKIGNDDLRDTRSHFVLVRNKAGQFQPAMISMASTQIKKSKRWMSRINGLEMEGSNGKPFNPPSFSHMYLLKSVREENSEGAWYGFEIEMIGPVEDADTYSAAKEFHAKVIKGEVQVQEPTADPGAAEETGAARGGRF